MDDDTMPWSGIAKATAAVAGGTFLVLTALCRSALNQQREEARPRWSDAARWERAGRDY